MRYMLLIYGNEQAWAAMSPEEQGAQGGRYDDYSKWLVDKGWMRAGDPLADTGQATTVRVKDGKTLTTDGPFAETKEQLGGYYIVECADLDEAIEAASKLPAASDGGSVEVRPIIDM